MIKFISYDGKYPNLCSGCLTVDIDGEIHKFHYRFYDNPDEHLHLPFWVSGGSCSWVEDEVTEGPWKLDVTYPDFSDEIYEQLIDIFNENVLFGCCGGCI